MQADDLYFEFGAQTDPGRKRKGDPNQDAVHVIASDAARSRPPLLIVADGMGGHAGGAIASALVIEAVTVCYEGASSYADIPVLLRECLRRSHEAITIRGKQESALASMGSTVVLVVPMEDQVFCANVGDSRAYLLNANNMRQISEDQSVVGEQVRAGLLTALQALRHPMRNRLTQSISGKRAVINPYVDHFPITKEDVLLLCTDGLWGVVPEAIVRAVAWELPPGQAAEKLVQLSKASGAPDNVSAVIARRKDTQGFNNSPAGLDETNPGIE